MSRRFELIFQRVENATQPEAFGRRDPVTGELEPIPHTYQRREEDLPIASSTFAWSHGCLAMLEELQQSGGDPDLRHSIGALLREFLTDLAWPIPEDLDDGGGRAAEGMDKRELALVTVRSSAAELYALPWELATFRGSNRHWADRTGVLVRYEWPGLPKPELPAAPIDGKSGSEGRVVLAWSRASGDVPHVEHLHALKSAVSRSRIPGVRVDEVPDVSAAALEEALSTGGCAVLHILCHGAPVVDAGSRSSLQWSSSRGSGIEEIDPDRLARLLDPFAKTLRLVVLCACHGGDAQPLSLFVGSVAQALHRRGIPAVVASRYPFSKAGSVRLTRALYGDLLAGGLSLEASLLRAREALQSPTGRIEGREDGDGYGDLSKDAYALQLYARSTVAVLDKDGSIAYRDADATYPFARAAVSLGRLVNVPEKPPYCLDRDSDRDRLKALILGASGSAVAVTGRTKSAGVHGMGGIGKSVLAACVAREDDVRRAFPDGVFWITLGREPRLTLLQSDFCALLGEPGAAFENEHRGRARLTELLRDRDRRCIVVLDDVWDAQHAKAFGELGPSGRLLITTRDAGIVTVLGAEACSLDVLPKPQALELLARWSGRRIEELPKEAHDVAEECGRLPLALAMIGAMVRGRPERWDTALQKLRKADLEAIRLSFPDYPYPDLLRAIEVSLDALEPSDRQRYLDFAVFAEDTPVPEAVLRTWWRAEGFEDYEAQDLLDRFVDRSLLRRDEEGRLELHDLQYDYVRKRAGDRSALHRRLVDAYASACLGGFATGPNDGYFFVHLATHLVGAGRTDELRRLLLDFVWLRAKLEATDPLALLADFDQVPAGDTERLVEGALRLSAHVLAIDKGQLAHQLLGRLLEEDDGDVRVLLESASRMVAVPSLLPYTASLTRPGGALRSMLVGHSSEVRAVAVTPDGQYVVSGSFDRTLKVWELSSGREIRALAGHSKVVTAVAVTPDGRYVVSGSVDQTLKVWELSSGREVRALAGHSEHILAVAVAPDGRYVVSGSGDGTVKVWELSSGHEVRTLAAHTSEVRAVAVTPDGQYVVSGSDDRTLKVWELLSGRQVRAMVGHSDSIYAVLVTPDGRYVVSVSGDQTLKVWELSSGREVRALAVHLNFLTSVAVTPDGQYVVLGSDDRTLRVWELSSGCEVRALAGHSDVVCAAAVTPDGRYVVSGSDDGTVRVWELLRGRQMCASARHSSWVNAVAVTPDGRYVVSGADDGTLKVWELSSGREVRALAGHSDSVEAVTVTPDGRYLVSSSYDLKVWELSSGREVRALVWDLDLMNTVAVTPDGRYVVSGSSYGKLKVWELSSGCEVGTWGAHSDRIRAVAVTPDGRYVVSGSSDGKLKVWELSSGREVRVLARRSGQVTAVAVTPDGRFVVSGSSDGKLKVWELSSGRKVREWAGNSSWVNAVVVTPDGRYVVSGSEDRMLCVWELDTGVSRMTFHGDEHFRSVAVAPDSRTVVAGDMAGRLHFLRLQGVS